MFPQWLHLVIQLVASVSSTRVLDFSLAHSAPPGSPLSSVRNTNVPERSLPFRFIICFSTKQIKIYNKILFIIYGEDKSA